MVAATVMILQGSCTAMLDSAWHAHRHGLVDSAEVRFRRAGAACPRHPAVQVGLGFVALRRGAALAARAHFRAAVALAPDNADAWYGSGLALGRLGDRTGAETALRRALAIAPHYTDALDALLMLGLDSGFAAAPPRPPAPTTVARTASHGFEVWTGTSWRPFYIKGINLGAARPGDFPADFPQDDSTYAHWIRLMAEANANTVRVYTIFPPVFYRALARWNAAEPGRALWLIHGVWTEPPPRDDYDHAAWKSAFRAEIRRVVDVLHGRARLPARPGHAWGRYDADVSSHALGIIIGREWEPATLQAYNARAAARTSFDGRFLAVDRGTPADAWMAEQCDYVQTYEWDTYHAARPVAYTNWPTLDPLPHVTEPTAAEEARLRKRLRLPPHPRPQEYDNDGVTLDAMLVRTTAANPAGYFAAFHAYPYYPDFVSLDSAYAPRQYLGYLRALRAHHAGRPVVIAEYGVPSSRGVAHLAAEGRHHGGHDETAMAAIDSSLTQDIRDAGLAGGILFAWLDEWFKHNWVVVDLAVPADRTPLWHNVENAEQHYGLLGQYAGPPSRPDPAGSVSRWRALPVHASTSDIALRVGADPAYLYLAIEGRPGFDSVEYILGLDTYLPDRGAFRLAPLSDPAKVGLEFALMLRDTADAELRIAEHYNGFLGPRAGMGPTALDAFYNWRATIDHRSSDGVFDSLFVTTNRFRVTRDGRTFSARGVNRGRLRLGRDWMVDKASGLVGVRLPWNLLNVTDPSSRRVLTRVRRSGPFATAATDGVRFVVASLDRRTGTVRTRLDVLDPFAWTTWERPTWHERLKPAYWTMRAVWGQW